MPLPLGIDRVTFDDLGRDVECGRELEHVTVQGVHRAGHAAVPGDVLLEPALQCRTPLVGRHGPG